MASWLGFEPDEGKKSYFISYNNKDSEQVAQIAMRLHQMGVPLWYDDGIPYDSKWQGIITKKIRASHAVILFFTKGILKKQESFVQKEYNIAREYTDRKIYAVILDEIDKKKVPSDLCFWVNDIYDRHIVDATATREPDKIAWMIRRAIQWPKSEDEDAEGKNEELPQPPQEEQEPSEEELGEKIMKSIGLSAEEEEAEDEEELQDEEEDYPEMGYFELFLHLIGLVDERRKEIRLTPNEERKYGIVKRISVTVSCIFLLGVLMYYGRNALISYIARESEEFCYRPTGMLVLSERTALHREPSVNAKTDIFLEENTVIEQDTRGGVTIDGTEWIRTSYEGGEYWIQSVSARELLEYSVELPLWLAGPAGKPEEAYQWMEREDASPEYIRITANAASIYESINPAENSCGRELVLLSKGNIVKNHDIAQDMYDGSVYWKVNYYGITGYVSERDIEFLYTALEAKPADSTDMIGTETSQPETAGSGLAISMETPEAGKQMKISWAEIDGAKHYEYSAVDIADEGRIEIFRRVSTYKTSFIIPAEYMKAGHSYRVWVSAVVDGETNGGNQAQHEFTVTACDHRNEEEYIYEESYSCRPVDHENHEISYMYDYRCADCGEQLTNEQLTWEELQPHEFNSKRVCRYCGYEQP